MTTDRAALASTVMSLLRSIASELEPTELDVRRPLRSLVDLDAMDSLNFLLSLHDRLGVRVPEADYARLVSFTDVLAYLEGSFE